MSLNGNQKKTTTQEPQKKRMYTEEQKKAAKENMHEIWNEHLEEQKKKKAVKRPVSEDEIGQTLLRALVVCQEGEKQVKQYEDYGVSLRNSPRAATALLAKRKKQLLSEEEK